MSQAVAAQAPTTPSRALHFSLWVVQGLLALAFLGAGFNKATQPMDALATMMPWTAAVGMALTRFIGMSEILGAFGLILPSATRIKPKLTALAAAGLTTIMVLAAGFHLLRGEYGGPPINLVLGGLAAFVAWGRGMKATISPR